MKDILQLATQVAGIGQTSESGFRDIPAQSSLFGGHQNSLDDRSAVPALSREELSVSSQSTTTTVIHSHTDSHTSNHSTSNVPIYSQTNSRLPSQSSSLSCSYSEHEYSIEFSTNSNVSSRPEFDVFGEQLSDSGISSSPLSVSSDVAQFLEGISCERNTSPERQLSRSISLCDSALSSEDNASPRNGLNNYTNFSDSGVSLLSESTCIHSEIPKHLSANVEVDTKKNVDVAEAKRPEVSYVEMIAKCTVSSSKGKVTLSEIYDYILTKYPYFETAPPAWRISVRHHLSTCDGFIKVGRVPLSRGFYWAAHPNCKQDFIDGIIEKKIMRKKIGNVKTRKRERKPVQKKQAAVENKESEGKVNHSFVTGSSDRKDLHCDVSKIQATSPVQMNTYGTVYGRLNALSDNIPMSSTPVRSYSDLHSGLANSSQSPVQSYGSPYTHHSGHSYYPNSHYYGQQSQSQGSWSDYSKSCANLANHGYSSPMSHVSYGAGQVGGHCYGQGYGTSLYNNIYGYQYSNGLQQDCYTGSSSYRQASLKTKVSGHTNTNLRHTPY